MAPKPKRGTKFNVIGTKIDVWLEHIRTDGKYVCCLTKNRPIDAEYEIFSPLKLKLAPKKFKSINPVSTGRLKQNKIYATLRKVYLENHKLCQAKLEGCTRYSSDVHHKAGRVGGKFLDITTWLPVCRNCHQWIEVNPTEAKRLGLSDSRL